MGLHSLEEFIRCLVVCILIVPNCPLEKDFQDADVSESHITEEGLKDKSSSFPHEREMHFTLVTPQCGPADHR